MAYTVPSKFLGHNKHAKDNIGIKTNSPIIESKDEESKTNQKSEIPIFKFIASKA